MTLNELKPGESAVIKTVGGSGSLRQHFLDMGVIPGAEATLIKLAPMGDPMELMIHGYELTLRIDDAKNIEVSRVNCISDNKAKPVLKKHKEHPGLGEEGKYHTKAGQKIPKGHQ